MAVAKPVRPASICKSNSNTIHGGYGTLADLYEEILLRSIYVDSGGPSIDRLRKFDLDFVAIEYAPSLIVDLSRCSKNRRETNAAAPMIVAATLVRLIAIVFQDEQFKVNLIPQLAGKTEKGG